MQMKRGGELNSSQGDYSDEWSASKVALLHILIAYLYLWVSRMSHNFARPLIHTRRLGSKATVKRLWRLTRVGGRGTVRMTGWPVSWASIKYWEFFEEGITPANRQGQRKMLNRSGVAIVDEPHSYLIHRLQSCENFQTVKTMYVIDGPVFLLNKADAFFRKNVLICNKNL